MLCFAYIKKSVKNNRAHNKTTNIHCLLINATERKGFCKKLQIWIKF